MVKAVKVVYADRKKIKCDRCLGKLLICSWRIPLPKMFFSEDLTVPECVSYDLYCRSCDERYFTKSYDRLEELEK